MSALERKQSAVESINATLKNACGIHQSNAWNSMKTGRNRQEALLALLQTDTTSSLAQMAEKLGWLHANGTVNKQLAHRTLRQLIERGLVKKDAGGIFLTKAGKPKASDKPDKAKPRKKTKNAK